LHAYQLSWFDPHLWAYAEHYGLPEIISKDFEHRRLYGSVRVRNPFLAQSDFSFAPKDLDAHVRTVEFTKAPKEVSSVGFSS
jgi:hypothetical protein